MRRIASVLLVAWALVSVGFVVISRWWYREREGRGGPIPVSQAGMLVTPLRYRFMPPGPIVDSFMLSPGDTVLEIGPGPGYFTPEAASRIGVDGRIVCVDLQPGMLDLLEARLRELVVSNAQPVCSDATRLPFLDDSVDAAFLVTVLGEVPDRPAALRELRRALRPGGKLSFVEMLGDPDYVAVDAMKDLCRAFGFVLLAHEPRWYGYAMTFAAPEAEAGYV